MKRQRIVLSIYLVFASLSALAAADCRSVQTANQKQDEDTIKRIERDWLEAEYRGNTAFLDCLLTPAYHAIAPKDHATRDRADLLARVAKNRGKTPDIPPLETTVVVNGEHALAFSLMRGKKKTGEPLNVRYVDSFFFQDGIWHALAGVDLFD